MPDFTHSTFVVGWFCCCFFVSSFLPNKSWPSSFRAFLMSISRNSLAWISNDHCQIFINSLIILFLTQLQKETGSWYGDCETTCYFPLHLCTGCRGIVWLCNDYDEEKIYDACTDNGGFFFQHREMNFCNTQIKS